MKIIKSATRYVIQFENGKFYYPPFSEVEELSDARFYTTLEHAARVYESIIQDCKRAGKMAKPTTIWSVELTPKRDILDIQSDVFKGDIHK